MHHPLVTIGMPIFNESKFIEDSLKSILAQEYPNLKIFIYDNASTDNTFEKCQALVKQDPRVILARHDSNLGSGANFIYTLNSAPKETTYFMWASGHDLWEPNYISECVNTLENHPHASIAYGTSHWVDESGALFDREYGWIDTRGLRPIARFFTILWSNMNPILGLIRYEYLNKIEFEHFYVGYDLIVLSKLGLSGDFIHNTKTGWSRREFRGNQSHSKKIKRYKSPEYKLSGSYLDKYFPLLKLPIELAKTIIYSDLSYLEKTFSLIGLLGTMPIRYINGKKQ